MDHATASKYRVILYGDQEDTHPIPPGLVKLHNFAHNRLLRFGMGGVSREIALNIVMLWMTTTQDGADFFNPPVVEVEVVEDFSGVATDSDVNWPTVTPGRKVIVTINEKPTSGEFVGMSGTWLQIGLPSEKAPKSFRPTQVQLVSV